MVLVLSRIFGMNGCGFPFLWREFITCIISVGSVEIGNDYPPAEFGTVRNFCGKEKENAV